MSPSPHKRREQGIALLMVLLGVAVLSVLALGLVLQTRAGVETTSNELQTSRLNALSNAVVLKTVTLLLSPNENLRPRIDGVPQTIEVLGYKIPLTVSSEFGKVDLNAATQATLARLFIAAGLGPDEANQEADTIIQWRQAGHVFLETDDLMKLPSIPPSRYKQIAPAITVYTGREQIDLATAPRLALEASGEDRQAAAATIRARDANSSTPSLSEVSNGKLVSGVSVTDWAFRIDANLTLGAWRQRTAIIIRMTGDPLHPYYTLWKRERAGSGLDPLY